MSCQRDECLNPGVINGHSESLKLDICLARPCEISRDGTVDCRPKTGPVAILSIFTRRTFRNPFGGQETRTAENDSVSLCGSN